MTAEECDRTGGRYGRQGKGGGGYPRMSTIIPPPSISPLLVRSRPTSSSYRIWCGHHAEGGAQHEPRWQAVTRELPLGDLARPRGPRGRRRRPHGVRAAELPALRFLPQRSEEGRSRHSEPAADGPRLDLPIFPALARPRATQPSGPLRASDGFGGTSVAPEGRRAAEGTGRRSVGLLWLRVPLRGPPVPPTPTSDPQPYARRNVGHLPGGTGGSRATLSGARSAGSVRPTIPDRSPDPVVARSCITSAFRRVSRHMARRTISTSSGLVVGRASAASRREPKYCSTTLVTLAVTMENSARAETLFPIHCAAYTALFFSPSATTPTTEPER
jgi:hypothetical protein